MKHWLHSQLFLYLPKYRDESQLAFSKNIYRIRSIFWANTWSVMAGATFDRSRLITHLNTISYNSSGYSQNTADEGQKTAKVLQQRHEQVRINFDSAAEFKISSMVSTTVRGQRLSKYWVGLNDITFWTTGTKNSGPIFLKKLHQVTFITKTFKYPKSFCFKTI